MVASAKVIHFLLILALIRGSMLIIAWSQNGINMEGGGCNADSNARVRRDALVEEVQGEAAGNGVVEGQPRMKRSLRELVGYRDYTTDYDLGPRQHPPINN